MENIEHALKKIIRGLIILSAFLNILSCNSGGDYTKELSGNYFYRDEGSNVKDIICHVPNCRNIYSKVIDYDYNKDFIIILQQPNYEEYKVSIAFELRSDEKKYPSNSNEEIVKTEKIADSILKCDPFYKQIFEHNLNYWIISNKENQIYGPFVKDEFLEKRKALGVPDNLRLKSE